MDKAYIETDKILKDMEKRIRKEYRKAEKEINQKLQRHLDKFAAKDADKRADLAAGRISKDEYNYWRQGQIITGKRWENMRDTITNDIHKTNEKTRGIVKENTPNIYAQNFNYGTYEVEKGARIDTGFTLYNEDAIKNILKNDPDLLPEPGKGTSERIRQGLEERWNKQIIQSTMMQGILQGESMPNLAKRLSKAVGDRNQVSAIRNARTMTTRAQNYGRLNSYKRAEGMGVKMKKQWVATLDHRTRDSHVDVDGEIVGVDETFSNGLDCPGGMGPPEEVYNCRCTMIAQIKGFEKDITDSKNRNVEGLGGMSYDEWKTAHREAKNNNMSLQQWLNLPESKRPMMKLFQSKGMKRFNKIVSDKECAYRPVKRLKKTLSEEEIIMKVGGGDMTAGSCTSAALAYAGNKAGWDVTDFRGGQSLDVFKNENMSDAILRMDNVRGLKQVGYNGFKITDKLFSKLEPEKEYILFAAEHTSIIRKSEYGSWSYLELQDENALGYNLFRNIDHTLEDRFGMSEHYYDKKNNLTLQQAVAIDVDSLANSSDFKRLLGYLNSKGGKQLKGAEGFAK